MMIEPQDTYNAMRDRDSMLHPAEYEYGMQDDSMDYLNSGVEDYGAGMDGMLGYTGDTSDSGMYGSGNYGGYMDTGGGLPGARPMGGMYGSQQEPKKDMDEQVVDFALKALKESWQFLKDCIGTYKKMTIVRKMAVGKESCVLGIIMAVIGVICAIFKVTVGWQLVAGGCVSAVLGVCIFFIMHRKYVKDGNTTDNVSDTTLGVSASDMVDEDIFEGGINEDDMFDMDAIGGMDGIDEMDDMDTQNWNESTDDDTEDSNNSFKFDEHMFDDIDDDEIDQDEDDMIYSGDATSERSKTELLDSINTKVVTRQYLMEKYMPVLETRNAHFADVTVLQEDSSEFATWVTILSYAVEALKPNEDAPIPQLLSVKKKLYYVVLEIQRVAWLKNLDKLAEEIVNTASYDVESNKRNNSMHAEATAAGKTIYVKIMSGENTALVTVKDVYKVQREYMLDPQNVMPVVIGLDINGQPVMQDLKTIESLLVAGAPRSGKSWFVKTLLAQMLMFNSPDDVQLYLCDAKDKVSDLIDIKTPHVKKFAASDDAIIDTIRFLAHDEGTRRQEEFSEAGVKTIWDYRKKCPEKKMPLIYVVIDEVTSLTARMTADDRKAFEKLLLEYITKLPCYGIRILLIPHMVKQQILSKSVTDMVSWKGCVRFSNTDICNVLDVKKFPYTLTSVGDMAVKTADNDVLYVHSVVMACTDAGYHEIFEYISGIWQRIDSNYIVDIEMVHGGNDNDMSSVTPALSIKREVQRKPNVKRKSTKSTGTTTGQSKTANMKAVATEKKTTDEDDLSDIVIW